MKSPEERRKELDEKLERTSRKKYIHGVVVINENHELLDNQKQILKDEYNYIEFLKVPSNGWTLEEMDEQIEKLYDRAWKGKEYLDIIFVSPIPYMIMKLTREELFTICQTSVETGIKTRVFHNDNNGWKLI